MNKILISQFYLIIFLSFPVLSNYPLIEPIDYNLPECEYENNKVVTKTKCLGELKNYLGYENTYFFGEIENGIPNGNGYLSSENFEYWGSFVEGRVEGYGTMSIPQDDYTYYGDFKNNRRTGFGVDLDKANGKYIGEYKNDQREGNGKYIAMEESAIYDEKWKQNKIVDSKVDYSGFREFDSGIGMKFNHAGHLSLLSKNMLEERISNLPDFYQGLSKRPHIERIAFWESNVFNLINEGSEFDRLMIEYDFIDDEEGEMLLSDERFYQGLYQDKYRFIFLDFSEYYENTVANNTIIKVNDRYYTISYAAPYKNESEQLKAEIKFLYFFNSWEFDVPENEKSELYYPNIKAPSLFGVTPGVKITNNLNPTQNNYNKWVNENYEEFYMGKYFEINPPIKNKIFENYSVITTALEDTIYDVRAKGKSIFTKEKCVENQLTFRNILLNKYKEDFNVITDNSNKENYLITETLMFNKFDNSSAEYEIFINCKLDYDNDMFNIEIVLRDLNLKKIGEEEYKDGYAKRLNQYNESQKLLVNNSNLDTSGVD